MTDTQAPEAPETSKVICDICGKDDIKNQAGLAAHKRFKHAAEAVPEVEAPPVRLAVPGPAKLTGMHRASGSEVEHGLRDIKLLRPICHECAPEVEKAGWGWWDRCPHDPYMGHRSRFVTDVDYVDEMDDAGNPTGNRIVGKSTTREIQFPYPNFVGVAKGRRYNNGHGPEDKMMWYGFISPIDLRSPAYPNGIAQVCDFRDCYWQEGLVTYESGIFCREIEAILVYENEMGTVPEVNNQDIRNDQIAVSRMKLLGSQRL